MKFPYSMLREFVRMDLEAEAVGDLLTMAGFEVEGVEEVEGDAVFDVKVTSNRGDGLSVLGLAREVLSKCGDAEPTDLYRTAVARFEHAESGEESGLPAPRVTIETSACGRYACRLFTGIGRGSTPDWMQRRLRQAGMRPISLLVDLTNYVMLEVGQPLHAFDFDKLIGGEIVVREPKHGENITTLDGKEHALTAGMMLICDTERPVAIAGVMGGQETEVSDTTRTVLLESAHFDSRTVRATRTRLGISTEASYRFERCVDPDGVVAAIQRFTQLLHSVQGAGRAEPSIVDAYPGQTKRDAISLRWKRTNLLLGMEVPPIDGRNYLERLGFEISGDQDEGIDAVPPSWRPDIQREEDLIEEIGRIHGYEKIPEALPSGGSTLGGSQGFERWKDGVREHAVRLGFTQTISHSLRDLHALDAPRSDRVGPRGISDPDMKWLRNSLLPSLADAVVRNGGRDLHLFEMGQTFAGSSDGTIVETNALAFYSHGALAASWWQSADREAANFFSLKGALHDLVSAKSLEPTYRTPMVPDPRLHPTRQAEIVVGGVGIGIIGQLHPAAAEEAALPADAVVAELDLRSLYPGAEPRPHVKPISRNPAVRRDIAFTIDRATPYERIQRAISESAGDILERQWLFDVYEGKGIPESKHSLAIALQLRKLGANLTDEEANKVREQVVAALATLGAVPR